VIAWPFPDTTSFSEIIRVFFAFVGLGWTCAMLRTTGYSALIVRRLIRMGWASKAGPRWQLTFGTFCSMVAFFFGWLGLISTGFIAAAMPAATATAIIAWDDVVRAEVVWADVFGWMIVGVEVAFGIGQYWMYRAWIHAKTAPRFRAPSTTVVPETAKDAR
jgi:hypothetical protein